MVDWARAFERFRQHYRRDDGTRWSGAALERATGAAGHKVSRHWVYKMLDGRIHDPSYEKIYIISKVMGVPLSAWAEEEPDTHRSDYPEDQ